jgi:hypothetical protein
VIRGAGIRFRLGWEMHWLSKFVLDQQKTVRSPADRGTVSLVIRIVGGLFLVIMALVLCFLVTLAAFYLIGLVFSRYFT